MSFFINNSTIHLPFKYESVVSSELLCNYTYGRKWDVEIIPMFNHLGHASACRELGGKHVVLDQNPEYEYLFDSYGWIWNIKRPDVLELLSKIREELIDVCGEGKFIIEAVKTAKDCELFGIIHTTRHTLFVFFSGMVNGGAISYGDRTVGKKDRVRFYCARRVARMALPSHGEYEKSGWTEK